MNNNFADDLRKSCDDLSKEEREKAQDIAMSIIYTGITREDVEKLKSENKLLKERNETLKLYLQRWIVRDLIPRDGVDPLPGETETILKWS